MSDSEKFDAIVVGGGVAGGTAAYVMAKAGLQVLLVERGNFSGSKNCTGGRLYAHSLEKIIPNFADEAPVERKVTKERVSMMTEKGAVTLDYSSENLGEQGKNSYVVCRALFDRWLMDKAEEEGALVVSGIRVDDLLVRDGKVCGIIAGGDEMEAEVVVLADGVKSLLAEKIGLKKIITPNQVAIGVKEVIELGEREIDSRFGLNRGEGMSWLLAGSATDSAMGGGFLYTNKDSISLGIVCTLSDLKKTDKTVPQMLNDLREHPMIKPLIKDGKLVEYSGHLVPEAGISMMPQVYGEGVLVVGDAAGLVINIGYMVRGMDLAIESGKLAAETIIEAKRKNDFSANALISYKVKLEGSFILKDLQQYRKFPDFLEGTPRIFKEYPLMLDEIMKDMFTVDGEFAIPIAKKMLRHLRKVGLLTLVKDGAKGVTAL